MKAAIERFLDTEEALEAEHQLVKTRWEKYERYRYADGQIFIVRIEDR